jgi:mono/diheme cytochrome c family protein
MISLRFGLALAAAAGLRVDAAPPNFYPQVEALMAKHCMHCHRPGEAVPMQLLTYEQVRPWAKAIRQAVVTRRMPPWHADPHVGKFSNNRALSEADIALLRDWVDAGAPKGKAPKSPAARTWSDGWTIGAPDEVFELPQAFDIPAKGELDYIHFAIPTNFTEDRWIQRLEVRPSNRAVVHHIGVYLRRKGSQWLPQLKPGEGVPIKDRTASRDVADEHFAMYLPGYGGEILPDGQARLIPAGAEIIFQLHYTPNGKPAKDRSRIGFVYAKQPVKERIHTIAVGNATFAIPPNDPNYTVNAFFRLSQPARALSVTAHMHLRGKAFACGYQLVDQQPVPLVNIPRYDRNWQMVYHLAEPVSLPRGSRLMCDAVFDNSANNPANPDPTATVRWGDQTADEMMVGYVDVALPADAKPEQFYRRSK